MRIEYYEIGYTGTIHKHYVDIGSENYISHTDDTVTFKDTYTNEHWEVKDHVVTRSRIFETVKLERVAAYKEEIGRYMRDLSVFENSKDYDHYWQLVRENR